LQAASQRIFERLKAIDSEIETFCQERRSLIAELEALALKLEKE
jgi:hypothetical protein